MKRKIRKRNPRDEKLLKQISISPWFDSKRNKYEFIIYLNSKQIGIAEYYEGNSYISFIKIESEFQRKGIASFLYDYIENYLGIKLKPSENLLTDGEAFWKNRLKRNPRDEELLKQIKITKETGFSFGYNWIHYKIWLNNELIGDAQYIIGKDYISLVGIKPKYQRKGLATFLYDYIERDQGIILRSDASTRSATAFWNNRLKQRKNPRDEKLLNQIKRGNPRDESLLEKLKIKKEKDKLNNSIIRYDVYYDNEVIGYSFFDKIRIPYYLDLIYIEPEFRRKGVAEFLTNYIEKDQKIKLNASPNMNKDGKAFWDSRLKNIK